LLGFRDCQINGLTNLAIIEGVPTGMEESPLLACRFIGALD